MAAWLIDGIRFTGPTHGQEEVKHKLLPLLLVALILGVDHLVREADADDLVDPVHHLTLGLFLLVINAGDADAHRLAGRASSTSASRSTGFWPAVGGAIVITVVTWIVDRVDRRRAPVTLPPSFPPPRHPGRVRRRAGLPRQHLPLADGRRGAQPATSTRPGWPAGSTVVSCGTGDWHIGQPMDSRAAATLGRDDYDPSTAPGPAVRPVAGWSRTTWCWPWTAPTWPTCAAADPAVDAGSGSGCSVTSIPSTPGRGARPVLRWGGRLRGGAGDGGTDRAPCSSPPSSRRRSSGRPPRDPAAAGRPPRRGAARRGRRRDRAARRRRHLDRPPSSGSPTAPPRS